MLNKSNKMKGEREKKSVKQKRERERKKLSRKQISREKKKKKRKMEKKCVGSVKWKFLCMELMRKRLSVIGYTNHVMSPKVWAQNPKSRSDRFHEAVILKALRKTTLRYRISSSACW